MTHVCSDCGSTNVWGKCWKNVNDATVVDVYPVENYCGCCESSCDLTEEHEFTEKRKFDENMGCGDEKDCVGDR